MIFDAAQELEGLQAVDAELFEKIVVGREGARRHVEMLRGQVEDLLRGLVNGAHGQVKFITILGQMKIARVPAGLEQNQAAADARGDSFGAGGSAKFAKDGADVKFGGVIGNVELKGDFLVAEAGGEHLEDFFFALR